MSLNFKSCDTRSCKVFVFRLGGRCFENGHTGLLSIVRNQNELLEMLRQCGTQADRVNAGSEEWPSTYTNGQEVGKVPKENIRASNEEFFGAADAAPSPSIDTNGQEVSKMFQTKFFHASLRNLDVLVIICAE
jgi:hypothetical protein